MRLGSQKVNLSPESERVLCQTFNGAVAAELINVWNARPPAVNFTPLGILGIALKRLISVVFLFVCNILLVW